MRRRCGVLGVALVCAVSMLSGGVAQASSPAASVQALAAETDAGLIAFVRGNRIFTIHQDGTGKTALTGKGKNYRPHWSPDGTRLAYVHETPSGKRDLRIMDADGSNRQRVTRLGYVTEAAWSPDGKWLAFGGDKRLPFEGYQGRTLRKVSAEQPFGKPTKLKDRNGEPQYVVTSLDWSRDGESIAFYSDTYPSSPDHYLLLLGLTSTDLAVADAIGGACCGAGYYGDPAFSPDGQTLLYTSLQWRPANDEERPPGSQIKRLDLSGGETTVEGAFGDADPDFSPSGERLVLSHWARIELVNSDFTDRTFLTRGYHPDWQPVS